MWSWVVDNFGAILGVGGTVLVLGVAAGFSKWWKKRKALGRAEDKHDENISTITSIGAAAHAAFDEFVRKSKDDAGKK